MKRIRVLLFVVSLCAASGQALAFDAEVVQGDGSCPTGRTLLDLAQATANQQEVCKALGQWYIARLAGGGSMDGPGYGCKIRPADERSLGHSLCAVVTQAQPDCSPGRELITIPELKRDTNGKLRAVLMLSDEYRGMWDYRGDRCMWQHLRYFKGWNVKDWNAADPPPSWPSYGEPIPGPTLRARIGDMIQISFLNQIHTKNFPTSLDVGEKGQTPGCDEAFGTRQVPVDPEKPDGPKKTIKVNVYPRNDTMPNCLHGSSTANLHFHGTHTTPATTGDNVLLYIRPASRDKKGKIEPTDDFVKTTFGEFFKWCETNGSPTKWEQLPEKWRDEQKRLLNEYDETAPYRGQPGKLPAANKLWPTNARDIDRGEWPQISIGAFPYCFRLPDYDDQKQGKVKMAQAPGTHWYHAHKHGSTALNVGNGMTGALIIEGPYDDELQKFYKDKGKTLEEKVLVIQQLETSLKMLSAQVKFAPAPLSVNGRRQPVITMRPGQVQLWRIVNGAPRTFVQFLNFVAPSGTPETVDWRQTAQDGVQFHPDNYERIGKLNGQFNMAGANRVDLLVRAPKTTGSYELKVRESVIADPTAAQADRDSTLLTVKVTGEAVNPPMEFIDKGSFPKFPDFLGDIPKRDVPEKDVPPPPRNRQLVFDTTPGSSRGGGGPPGDLPLHTIDGKLFSKNISQSMVLNSVEEWILVNKAVGIAHPFHIHINPFQVVAAFDPNSAEASDVNDRCYADPKDSKTWDPKTRDASCDALEAPFVWWDALAIPSARQDPLDCVPKDGGYECPNKADGGECTLGGDPERQQCKNVKIPGYFKMRSRFADFPGLFVQHCHILAHEDRGMMQFVEICPEGGPCPTKTRAEAIPTHH